MQLTGLPEAVRVGNLPLFVDMCIWNVAQTDTRTIAEAILNFNPATHIVSIFSAKVTRIINELIASVCPGEPACSDRGTCSDSVCTCNEGMTTAHRLH